jgi:hypothetical protein
MARRDPKKEVPVDQLGDVAVQFRWSFRRVLGFSLAAIATAACGLLVAIAELSTGFQPSFGGILIIGLSGLFACVLAAFAVSGVREPALVLHQFGMVSYLNRRPSYCLYLDVVAITNESTQRYAYGLVPIELPNRTYYVARRSGRPIKVRSVHAIKSAVAQIAARASAAQGRRVPFQGPR